jgi:HEAT repeat protein
MDVSQPGLSGPGTALGTTPVADPRLQPTPDYGTLGPGSDIAGRGPHSTAGSAQQPANPQRSAAIFAATIGVLAALFVGNIGNAHAAWAKLFSARDAAPTSAKDTRQLDRMRPQKQAEALLELAVGNNEGAVDQISSRVDRWQGKVQWSPQIAQLTTAALNSPDMRVRESGVEVELAAYGLGKNAASLDYLIGTTDSPNHARKIWALWAIGLMGNRGVGTDRVGQVLTAHLKDADVDSRRWAVEGLALSGATEAIETLLQTMHDDPSPLIRERAACSLAESGMFTHEQRLSAVPRLVTYTDDPSLDAQTHGWASQALTDITRQHFGNDSNAWRNWYQSSKSE